MIETGRKAPDFALPGVEAGDASVYELFKPIEDGETVLLWFVPATFLPPATAELRAIEKAGWHDVPGLRVWVLSMDSIYAAAAYADRHDLSMAFLGDAGGTAKQYGVAYEEFAGHYGVPQRAVFLVDPDWAVGFGWTATDAFEEPSPSPAARIAGEITDRFPEANRPPSVEYDGGR